MYENPHQGIFVVFEGPDGSGQDTQAEWLQAHLTGGGNLPHEKWSLLLTREPTMDSESGRQIRRVLEKKETMEPAPLQKLYVQDRREHLENTIIPGLKNNSYVISVRYFFSTCAFGGINMDIEQMIQWNDEFILPDITFVLDVDPEICMERIGKRGKKEEFFETKRKLAKVRENYRYLAEKFSNCFLIDGEPSVEIVHDKVLRTFKEWGEKRLMSTQKQTKRTVANGYECEQCQAWLGCNLEGRVLMCSYCDKKSVCTNRALFRAGGSIVKLPPQQCPNHAIVRTVADGREFSRVPEIFPTEA